MKGEERGKKMVRGKYQWRGEKEIKWKRKKRRVKLKVRKGEGGEEKQRKEMKRKDIKEE